MAEELVYTEQKATKRPKMEEKEEEYCCCSRAIPAVRLNRSLGYVLTVALCATVTTATAANGAWSCPAPATPNYDTQLRARHGRRFVADCIFVLVCAE